MTEVEQEFAKAWRPENAGDRIEGTVVDVTPLDRGWGVYPCVTLRTVDGDVAIHAFHTVLRTELAKRRPKVGDELEVVYGGRKDSAGSANGYHAYRVVGGEGRAYNWDADLPESEREALAAEVPIAPDPTPSQAAPAPQTAAYAPDDDDLPF